MGMPVRIIVLGITRRAGFTGGPTMGMRSSSSAGPRSRGTPPPVNTRPSSDSENGVSAERPMKHTSALVGTPRVPEKTCMVTWSPSRRITCASDENPGASTVASSWLPTSVACTVMTLPAICEIRW